MSGSRDLDGIDARKIRDISQLFTSAKRCGGFEHWVLNPVFRIICKELSELAGTVPEMCLSLRELRLRTILGMLAHTPRRFSAQASSKSALASTGGR